MNLSKKCTILVSLVLTLFSINLAAQENAKTASRVEYSNVSKIETAIIVFHNNDPSNVSTRDFTWSIEGIPSDSYLKEVTSKLKSNPYFSAISFIESGVVASVFIKFSITEKYEEAKILDAFNASGVLFKRALDQESISKIKG